MFTSLASFNGLNKEDPILLMSLSVAVVSMHILWQVYLLVEEKGKECMVKNVTAMIFSSVITSLMAHIIFGEDCFHGMVALWLLAGVVVLYRGGN